MTTDTTGTQRPMVLAAGGIVLDGPPAARRVLVVHRPVYDDWSLPKGHVEPGEDLMAAALREVAEETAVTAVVEREAGTTEHDVTFAGVAARKRVHWFLMRPDGAAGDPIERAADRAPDAEVDRATWWPVDVATRDLTHEGERALLLATLTAS